MSLQRTGLPFGGFAVPYLEVGWVCAPNTAGQSITSNAAPATCTLDTVVQNTESLGVTIATNQIQNLPAGTYYFEAHVPWKSQGAANTVGVLALYNVSDTAYVSRGGSRWNALGNGGGECFVKGQFKIASAKTFDLRVWLAAASGTLTLENSAHSVTVSLATASADQRTTIRIWKVG